MYTYAKIVCYLPTYHVIIPSKILSTNKSDKPTSIL